MKIFNDKFSRANLTKKGLKYFKNVQRFVIDKTIDINLRYPWALYCWTWSLSLATFHCLSR
jgi:hypothetical protein